MTTLQSADTHNLVAFLSKPAESEGFEQIIEFLKANPIKYALTINPTIYSSCIKQFRATAKVKTFNGEVQLQALVDGKKIIVTEASVRRDLQLNDEEGTDCLPTATIFEELTRMGYEKLSQKLTFYKFSSTMASAIICLATNQKFNFSKYIFESMVKNLDNAGKFLMYPRSVQVFLDKQLKGMQSHKRIYVTPSHTKKIFRNIRRVGKGFSGRETPLFQTMMVQAQEKMGEGSANPTDPHHTPTIIQPSTSLPQLKQRSRRPKIKDTKVPQPSGPIDNVIDEAVNEEMDDSLVRAATTASSLKGEQDSGSGPRRQDTTGDTIARTRFENVSKTSNDSLIIGFNTPRSDEDRLKLNELMEFYTKLQQRVHDLGRYSDEKMFDTSVLYGDEVLAEPEVTIKDVNLSVDEVTLAQALAALKSAKVQEKANVVEEPSESITTTTTAATTITAVSTRPKAKGLVIHEEEQATTPTVSSQQPSQVKAQDKGKGIMLKKKKKKGLLEKKLKEKQKPTLFHGIMFK
ncbi:hypothetical protein Tco_1050798 [Tanacetum coccineum]